MTSTPQKHGALRLSGRILGGALALGAAVVIVGAAIIVPTPTVTAAAPRTNVDPAPGATTLVCSASYLVGGRDPLKAQALSVAGTSTLSGATGADVTTRDAPIEGIPDAVTRIVHAPAVDGERAAVAGATSIALKADDIAGYAASSCRPAITEGWFVGLDTRTGSSGVIVITNPGDVPSTVTLTAYGESGPSEPVTTLTIPAGEATAMPVAALVGAEFSPVVHLSAEGAPVTAIVQAAAVRGLNPAGVDLSDPVRANAQTQVMPGVRVSAGPGAATSVRLLATDTEASATIELRSESGEVVWSEKTDLVPGIPTEIAAEDVKVGTYDAVVIADAPIVAAAWTTTGATATDDFAWYPAAPEISEAASFGVARGATARLRLVNPSDADVAVTVRSGGAEHTVTVPAEGSVDTPLNAAGAATMTPEGSVFAAVVYVDGQARATTAVWPADAGSPTVTVTR